MNGQERSWPGEQSDRRVISSLLLISQKRLVSASRFGGDRGMLCPAAEQNRGDGALAALMPTFTITSASTIIKCTVSTI
jgi:hypothetical protein